jgi:hypothetical protein
MRLASFNVANLFDRAVALNQTNRAAGISSRGGATGLPA